MADSSACQGRGSSSTYFTLVCGRNSGEGSAQGVSSGPATAAEVAPRPPAGPQEISKGVFAGREASSAAVGARRRLPCPQGRGPRQARGCGSFLVVTRGAFQYPIDEPLGPADPRGLRDRPAGLPEVPGPPAGHLVHHRGGRGLSNILSIRLRAQQPEPSRASAWTVARAAASRSRGRGGLHCAPVGDATAKFRSIAFRGGAPPTGRTRRRGHCQHGALRGGDGAGERSLPSVRRLPLAAPAAAPRSEALPRWTARRVFRKTPGACCNLRRRACPS